MGSRWTIVTGVIAITLWLAWVIQKPVIQSFSIEWDSATLGQWGDTFGALSSLFAGCAAIGVVATLRLQRQASAEQKMDQDRQRFESHFFQLLGLLRELRQGVKVKPSAVAYTGAEAIAYFASTIRNRASKGTEDIASATDLADAYREVVHQRDEAGLGTYFRTLFNILKLISQEKSITEPDRIFYANAVRAQLSSDDLHLIGFNGLMPESGKLSKYIKEFRLLKYMPEGVVRSIFLLHYGDQALSGRNDD
ncbi:hypothetical protein REJC140_00123 [Pseudorhizobium endolithicum]|uniref:Phage abortive infection protein n=1 Tax=Pseudorhizobium endolithicum TaxID=1191678 RepID=A0ABM8PCL2_9HYPH|nr:putative phage abortive infection protein [Pseudorhizobium endolithicum]CAD7023190.1 hypothetical protein REJC140_00123 [Pseudorhizobium endolithicum]